MTNVPAVYDDAPKAGGLTFSDLAQVVSGAKELPDTEVDALMIAAQIMGASSLEEGLGEQKAEPLNDHIGELFMIHDFKLNRSDEAFKDQGAPVYAVIDATLRATGERVVLTSGSYNVLASLGLILKLDQWGETFRAVKVDTKSGFKTTKLVYEPTVGEGSEAF